MKTIPATFENGVFRPKSPVDLPSGTELDIIVPEATDDPVAILKARYPESFGGFPEGAAREIMAAINDQFGRINQDAWK